MDLAGVPGGFDEAAEQGHTGSFDKGLATLVGQGQEREQKHRQRKAEVTSWSSRMVQRKVALSISIYLDW